MMDRRLIWGVGAVVVIALIATFVWLPLERTRARLAAELPALRASIPVLEQQGEEAKRLRALPPVARNTNEPLSGVVSFAKPLPGAQVTVLDGKTVGVTGADVAYGALLEWIAAVQASHGLRVESARIDALPVTGRVRAELRLVRS